MEQETYKKGTKNEYSDKKNQDEDIVQLKIHGIQLYYTQKGECDQVPRRINSGCNKLKIL